MKISFSKAGQSVFIGGEKKKKKVEIVAGFSVTGECYVGRGTACISITSKVKNLSTLKQLSRS